jgi:hypothetical protein
LESELNWFVIKDEESPQYMFNRLNKIINKIKSLRSTRLGRREEVDKILSAYMARHVQLPTLTREKRCFNKFTLNLPFEAPYCDVSSPYSSDR